MRRFTMSLVGIASLVAASCGGGGGSKSCVGAEDVTGVWHGNVLSDAFARGNPGTIDTTIAQNDCTLVGNWLFTFQEASHNRALHVSGSAPLTSEFRFDLFDLGQTCDVTTGICSEVDSCDNAVEATLVGPNEMTGTYATTGDRCTQSASGSFDITLRARLTPTRVVVIPTSIAAPTPTPTPPPA